MARYSTIRPRARSIVDPEGNISETADTVFVEDEGVFATGILDHEGRMIWRRNDPIGYRPPDEDF